MIDRLGRLARSRLPRVLFVSHAFGGGIGRHIDDLARALEGDAEVLLVQPFRDSYLKVRWLRSGESLSSHDGSLLIGADGIHSAVRAKLYPGEGPPIWNGAILWRGVTKGSPYLDGRTGLDRGVTRHAAAG